MRSIKSTASLAFQMVTDHPEWGSTHCYDTMTSYESQGAPEAPCNEEELYHACEVAQKSIDTNKKYSTDDHITWIQAYLEQNYEEES